MSVTLDAALKAGLKAHTAGQISHAIEVYSAILQLDPSHGTARHLRGFALLQGGREPEALPDLTAALEIAPANAAAWTHLSVCLNRLGQPSTDAARRALALHPQAHEALDVLVSETGVDAPHLRQLLILSPHDPATWNRAGYLQSQTAPGTALRNLRRAHCLAPNDPANILDRADLQRRLREPDLALKLASQSLMIRPHNARAYADRAAAATELDEIAAALADTRRAVLLDPAITAGLGNRAEALYRQARYGEAVVSGARALVTRPQDPDVQVNMAAYLLAAGELTKGWELFRSRTPRPDNRRRDLPRWRGEDGADLLVLAEQGLGDEMLFSTLWHDLDARVADGRLRSATIEADGRLIDLGARALPHLSWRPRFSAPAEDPAITHWCLAGDLPELFRPTVDTFADARPGLLPAPEDVASWRRWLDQTAAGRPAIGLCWRSSSLAGRRRPHYPAIADCAPLLARPDSFFVVLQYDDCSAELSEVSVGPGSEIVLPPGLDRRDDQAGVAALIAALDLVVSADTAVLALAGALGRPAVGLSLHPGWLGLGQERHPWFPTVERVYRAAGTGWRDTLARAARTVDRRLAR